MENVKNTDKNGLVDPNAAVMAIASCYAYPHRNFDVSIRAIEQPFEKACSFVKQLFAGIDNGDYSCHNIYDRLTSDDGVIIHALAEDLITTPGNRIILILLFIVAEGCGYVTSYTLHENEEVPIKKYDLICITPDKSPEHIEIAKEYYSVALLDYMDNYLKQYLELFTTDGINPSHPYVHDFSFSDEELDIIKYAYSFFPEELNNSSMIIGVKRAVKEELKNNPPQMLVKHMNEIIQQNWDESMSMMFDFCPCKEKGDDIAQNKDLTYGDIFKSLHDVNAFECGHPYIYLMNNDIDESILEMIQLPFRVKIIHEDGKSLICISYSVTDADIYTGYTVTDDAPFGSIDCFEVIYSPKNTDGFMASSKEIEDWVEETLEDSNVTNIIFTTIFTALEIINVCSDELRLVEFCDKLHAIVPKCRIDKCLDDIRKADGNPKVISDKPWYESLNEI